MKYLPHALWNPHYGVMDRGNSRIISTKGWEDVEYGGEDQIVYREWGGGVGKITDAKNTLPNTPVNICSFC